MVEAHIQVLERVQPRLNPLAVQLFDEARAEADAADLRVAAGGALPPLHGVPCTLKEIFAVAGLPHTAGVVARRGVRAISTAPIAQRLLDAGAILIGLTNTAELAAFMETDNRVYGRTSNPYDPRRTAGGSSGGCGAAVASGGSPVGLATDGVSIRVPAFCCGVFGHRPSLGLVPLEGSFPPVRGGEVERVVRFGPIVRRAEDLAPVLRIIGTHDVGEPAHVQLDGLRVVLAERCFVGRISREQLEVRERAAEALACAGARVERIALPEARHMLLPTLASFADGGSQVLGSFRPGGQHMPPVRLMIIAERLWRLMPRRRTRTLIERGRAFAAELDEQIGDGVLLHPTLPTVAPRHGATYRRLLFFQPVGVLSLIDGPVTQVPLGFGASGLPLGVQVAAGPGRDHVSIAVALELERVFGGWSPP